jgi:hypothetical protein
MKRLANAYCLGRDEWYRYPDFDRPEDYDDEFFHDLNELYIYCRICIDPVRYAVRSAVL